VAALTAVITEAAQIVDPMFLQSGEPVEAYSDFGSTSCQFVVDGSWYSYINTVDLTPTYYESTGSGDTVAYFTFCQDLSNTNVPSCSGSSYATISQLSGT